QHRDAPVFVVVDAHAKIDLGGAWIGVVGLGQAEDRITRNQWNVRKEGHGGSRRRKEGEGPSACAARPRNFTTRPFVASPRRCSKSLDVAAALPAFAVAALVHVVAVEHAARR